MRHLNRKTAPKVVGGKTQRKNRWAETPNYYNTPEASLVISRNRPGPGCRHVLLKRDVERFIEILPDWNELAKGLNAIVLDSGNLRCDGWHRPGVVADCAWPRNLEIEMYCSYFEQHRSIFEQLGVPWEKLDDDGYLCEFTDSTVRAYQLLHILLHELGHHHDRMTTKSKRRASRGEGYAEHYAIEYAERIWERFLNEFGMP